MAPKWLKTSDIARMVDGLFPADDAKVREYCENGTIPPKFAKRHVRRTADGKLEEYGHWMIKPKALRWILTEVFGLDADELAEVKAKAPANFRLGIAA